MRRRLAAKAAMATVSVQLAWNMACLPAAFQQSTTVYTPPLPPPTHVYAILGVQHDLALAGNSDSAGIYPPGRQSNAYGLLWLHAGLSSN
jgi:hypothetical protein